MAKPIKKPRHSKDKLIELSKEAIVKNNLFFIDDIVAYLPISRMTFYNYFSNTKEIEELREMLDENKIKTKSSIRAKLFRSEKAGELLALYKLICSDDERKMLNQQYIDHTSKEKEIKNVMVIGDKEIEF